MCGAFLPYFFNVKFMVVVLVFFYLCFIRCGFPTTTSRFQTGWDAGYNYYTAPTNPSGYNSSTNNLSLPRFFPSPGIMLMVCTML